MKTTLFIVLFAMLIPGGYCYAQLFETEWEKQLSIAAPNSYADAVENTDGSFTVSGLIDKKGSAGHDLWLLKFSKTGDTLWTRTYTREGTDIPARLAIHPEGGYLLAAINAKNNELTSWAIRINADGSEKWRKDYSQRVDTDRTDIAINADGTWWWMNTLTETNKPAFIRLSLMNNGGEVISEYSFEDKLPIHAHALRLLPDQSLAISGQIEQGKGTSSLWVMRANPSGELLWKTTIPVTGKKITPECICCTPDNHLVIAGWIGSCMNPDAAIADQIFEWDLALSKINGSGKHIWTKNFDREGSEGGNAVAVLPDGKIIIAGKCETSFTGTIGPWLILADINGKQLFEQVDKFRFSGDQASRIIMTSDGGFLLVGPGKIQPDVRKASGWIKKIKIPAVAQ